MPSVCPPSSIPAFIPIHDYPQLLPATPISISSFNSHPTTSINVHKSLPAIHILSKSSPRDVFSLMLRWGYSGSFGDCTEVGHGWISKTLMDRLEHTLSFLAFLYQRRSFPRESTLL